MRDESSRFRKSVGCIIATNGALPEQLQVIQVSESAELDLASRLARTQPTSEIVPLNAHTGKTVRVGWLKPVVQSVRR
jgi:hypothetical protein